MSRASCLGSVQKRKEIVTLCLQSVVLYALCPSVLIFFLVFPFCSDAQSEMFERCLSEVHSAQKGAWAVWVAPASPLPWPADLVSWSATKTLSAQCLFLGGSQSGHRVMLDQTTGNDRNGHPDGRSTSHDTLLAICRANVPHASCKHRTGPIAARAHANHEHINRHQTAILGPLSGPTC